MWRYFENVDNPKKRKRSDEERTAAKKAYEEKRKRKWLGAKWKEGGQREWLEYDEEDKSCSTHGAKSMNRRQSPFGVSNKCIKQITLKQQLTLVC